MKRCESAAPDNDALKRTIAKLEYLTRGDDFFTVSRGDPLPSSLSDEKRREVGLDRDTWRLEVVADEATGGSLKTRLLPSAARRWIGPA